MSAEHGLFAPVADQKVTGLINGKERVGNGGKTIIMSYRLPVVKKQGADGEVIWERTVGGMATAIDQAINSTSLNGQRREFLWYGWLGESGETQGLEEVLNPRDKVTNGNGYSMRSVDIPPDEFKGFYYQTSNMGLWPAMHGYELKIKRNAADVEQGWLDYVRTNERFAQEYAKDAKPGDALFVQDYQLALVGQSLRELGFGGRINYFLHIPFPPPEIFFQMPHAQDIIHGLLHYDRIGFQTERDKINFEACTVQLTQEPENLPLLEATPISINPQEWVRIAQKEHVQKMANEIKERYSGQQIMFTGGRLDYTKGFVENVLAYYLALKENPALIKTTKFVMAAPKSRESIPDYQKYARQLDIAVKMINKRCAVDGWQPVVMAGQMDQDQMAAYYLAADVMLAGSRADGMNLTPKEAVAASSIKKPEDTGVLIVSKGAGASNELTGSLTFDPTNIREQATTMVEAFTMPNSQRIERRRINEEALWKNPIANWAGRGNLYSIH